MAKAYFPIPNSDAEKRRWG